jgi:LacI family transcriptional regulator
MDTILFFHTSLRQAWRKELAGAYRYARTRGWRVQVVEPREGVTPPVARLAAFWNPVGCIAECSGDGGGRLSPRLFRGIPTVFLGRDPRSMPPEASFVAPSSAGIGERAARVFLEAGISSFAFIAQSARHFWSLDREADFANSLAIHGFKCRVFGRDVKWRQDGARASALAEFLKSLPRPCGILAENDYAAAEVLDLARKMRLHVPNDIAVIGVDNDADLCENARPSLTSVALDFEMA